MDLLRKIDVITIELNTIWASVDVEALYSSIHHEKVLEAVRCFLSTWGAQFQEHNGLIMELLTFILTKNHFLFKGTIYHQLRDTTMGNSCAPTYANLILGWWEETVVLHNESSVFHLNTSPWARYIDDVFIQWTGTEYGLKESVEILNNNHIGLKFTFAYDLEQLTFFDVTKRESKSVSLSTWGTLTTKETLQSRGTFI